MRKNIARVIEAFTQGKALKDGPCSTDGKKLFSYELAIATRKPSGEIKVTESAEKQSKTTASHIDAIKSWLEAHRKVVITAHMGYLIINAANMGKASNDWIPIGSGRIGCVIANTKKHLQVSEEALELLGKIKRCGDDIGDVDWFESGDMKVFGWLGPSTRLVNPAEAVGSRTYKVYRDDCTIVPNNPPQEAINAIEKSNAGTNSVD